MNFRSPFRRRMAEFSARLPPPPWFPDADIIAAHVERLAKMDVAFRLHVKELNRRLPLFWLTRVRGGSGFLMASMLRHYFAEYLNRWAQHGPYSLPSSFNVVESFLLFNERYQAFDLRPESEHLLTADDYFEWYTANDMPGDPQILIDVMQEGIVYSYDMTSDAMGFCLSTGKSKLAIAGVSLVRHDSELSLMLVAGEQPPNPPDAVVAADIAANKPGGWSKKGISSDPGLGIKDRYLVGLPDFGRVILLTRFDLRGREYDVRYINLDFGQGYRVLTDDVSVFPREVSAEDREAAMQRSLEGLDRYNEFFSGAAALMYLPVAFIDEAGRVTESRFVTELHSLKNERPVRQAISELGEEEVMFSRTV